MAACEVPVAQFIIWVQDCENVKGEFFHRKVLISSNRPELDQSPTFFAITIHNHRAIEIRSTHHGAVTTFIATTDSDAWDFIVKRFFFTNCNIDIVDLSILPSKRPIKTPRMIEVRDRQIKYIWEYYPIASAPPRPSSPPRPETWTAEKEPHKGPTNTK